MNNLEFDISGESIELQKEKSIDLTAKDTNTKDSQESQIISFSSSVIEALQYKLKHFNEHNKPLRVTLPQLRSVYRNGAGSFARATHWQEQFPEKTCGEWAMSRVNMFLRMKGGDKRKAQVETINFNKFIDISESWCPIQEDFDQAKEDIKKYNLNYHFKDIEELYLEDYEKIDLDY